MVMMMIKSAETGLVPAIAGLGVFRGIDVASRDPVEGKHAA